MEFEWDPAKRLTNVAKHGIDFHTATMVFESFWLSKMDMRRDYGELRRCAVGVAFETVLVVTFTDRLFQHGMVRRIISARRASEREKEDFYESKQRHDRLGTPSEHD